MAKKKPKGGDKLFAFLGVFLTVIGFILVLLAKKEDKYAMYYAKLGLVIFLGWVAVWVVGMIPFIGYVVKIFGGIALLVLWVMALIGSLSREEKHIPLMSEFAKKIDL